MTSYHRLIQPEGTYFFTLCLENAGGRELVEHIDRLRVAWAFTLQEMPVVCHAMVVLPNHLHAVLTEPGFPRFSERWRRIKARFSHAVEGDFRPNASKQRKGERGLWQRRFYEHAIRDEVEFQKAIDYCRVNPVKHGLVARPEDWPFSSFAKAKA